MDALPVLSQFKSLFQAVCGDPEGALRTQENFSRQCPVISQARSFGEWVSGDSEAAEETQKQCLGFVSDFVDGIPVVGHAKGGIHYACGDKEGGDKAMKSSSRTVGVLGGGVAGFFVAGPVGAAAGGVAGGLAVDGLTTGIDSAIHDEYRPSGMVSQVTEIVKNPKDPGLWFDTLAIPVFDAMSGVSAGKGAAKLANKIEKRLAYNKNKTLITKKVGKSGYRDISQTAKVARQHMRKGDVKHNVPQVVTHAKDLKTNKSYYGVNKQLRQNLRKTRGGMSRGQAKKSSMFKGSSKSNVQKRVPNAKNVLGRDQRSCAEHSAVHKLYNDRPSAKPNEIRTSTVRVNPKKGTITALKRCKNCKQYDPVMGHVPTDAVHGMPILENPGEPVSKSGAALVAGGAACSAVKQRSKPSSGAAKSKASKGASSNTSKHKSSSDHDKTKSGNEEPENGCKARDTMKIKYEKSQKLHKKKCGKVRRRLLGESTNRHRPRVDDGDSGMDPDSDGEIETVDDCTSELDEGKENVHQTRLVKKLR